MFAGRTLRPMIGVPGERPDRALAEPGAQAFEAGRRALADRRLLEKMGAGAGPGDHLVGGQTQGLDRRRQLQTPQMLAQQAQETPVVGTRLGQAQGQRAVRAVVVRQVQRAGTRQQLAGVQPAAQCREQALPGEGQSLGMLDAGRQFEIAGKVFAERRRAFADRATRRGRAAGRRPGRCRGAGAGRRQAPAPGRRDGAGRRPASRSEILGRPAGHGTRQSGQRRLHGRQRRMNLPVAGLRQPACAERRRRRCPGDRIGLFGTAGQRGLDDGRRPAEEAQAAADFQQQAGRRRQADGRREPPGPAGEAFQHLSFERRVALADSETGLQAERRRQFLAAGDPGRGRRPVASQHAATRDDGARRAPPGQRFERQQGKVQGQPQHGSFSRDGVWTGSAAVPPAGRGA